MRNRFVCSLCFAVTLAGCAPSKGIDDEIRIDVLNDNSSAESHLSNEELLHLFDQIVAANLSQSDDGENRLLALASHRDFLVRIRAVKALSEEFYLRRDGSFMVLLQRLNDPHWLVRSYAAKGLGRGQRNSALPALNARLAVETNQRVRGFIETAIAALTE